MQQTLTWMRLGAVAAALAVGLACGVASDVNGTSTAPSGWVGAVRLDVANTASSATAPSVAVDATGNVYPVWQQVDANGNPTLWGDPYLVSSTAWLGEGTLDAGLSGANATPKVAVGGNGVFMYAWVRSQGYEDSEVYVDRWSAANGLDSAVRVNAGFGVSPAVAMNANGDACVVWTELGTSSYTVLAAFRTVNATAWTAPIQVSSGLANALDPQVGVDDSDNLVVLWAESASTLTGPYTLKVTRYTTAKGWSTPASPQAGALADPNYALVMNDSGAQVAWSDSSDGGASWQVYTTRWTAAQDAWSTRTRLSAATGINQKPTLGLSSGGNAIAVWVTGATALNTASYSSGGGWPAAPTLFLTASAGVDAPRFSMNAGGSGTLAWLQSDGTTWRIAAAPYTSAAGWTAPAYIQVPTGGAAQAPAVYTGSGGQAVVAWAQLGTDNLEHLYANVFN